MLETPPSLVLGRHRLQRRDTGRPGTGGGGAWRLTPSCVGPVSGLQAPTGVTEGNRAVSLLLERACPLEKSYLDAFTPATARAELVRARNHAATPEAAGRKVGRYLQSPLPSCGECAASPSARRCSWNVHILS